MSETEQPNIDRTAQFGRIVGRTAEGIARVAVFTTTELLRLRKMPAAVPIATFAIGLMARPYLPDQLTQLLPSPASTGPTPNERIIPISPTANPRIEVTRTPEAQIQLTSEVFNNKDANEALKKYGMHAGSFFKVEEKVLQQMTAFKSEDLYPIYPPAVMAQKELIYKYAQKYKTHPNVIAMLMSIESAGKPDAGSHMGAQGLMQVMPDKFPVDIQDDPSKMQEKDLNVGTGVDYFVNVCIPNALKDLSGKYSSDNVHVIAKAAVFYNGGPNRIGQEFDSLPDESKFYGDHIIRYALTAQIAGELRLKGYTDRQIVEALKSDEIDARAHAIGEFHSRNNGNYFYTTYDNQIKQLGTPNIDKTNPYYEDYQEYLQNKYFKVPLPAGTRIWSQLGGFGLLQSMPENVDPNEWLTMQSRRN